jgi:hypothetical protein
MNVSDAIRLKRAVRKFQDKPLPDDVVLAILNAGRRSQSSKNTQAWVHRHAGQGNLEGAIRVRRVGGYIHHRLWLYLFTSFP